MTFYLDFDGALPPDSVDLDPFGEVLGGGVGQRKAGVILLIQQNRLHLRQLVVPTAGVAARPWLRIAIPTKPDACSEHQIPFGSHRHEGCHQASLVYCNSMLQSVMSRKSCDQNCAAAKFTKKRKHTEVCAYGHL